MCDNTVIQYVERGFDVVEVELRCGSTGVRGDALWCEECKGSERVRRIMENSEADNAWLRSAGWGEM